jgi:hypothetical protein
MGEAGEEGMYVSAVVLFNGFWRAAGQWCSTRRSAGVAPLFSSQHQTGRAAYLALALRGLLALGQLGLGLGLIGLGLGLLGLALACLAWALRCLLGLGRGALLGGQVGGLLPLGLLKLGAHALRLVECESDADRAGYGYDVGAPAGPAGTRGSTAASEPAERNRRHRALHPPNPAAPAPHLQVKVVPRRVRRLEPAPRRPDRAVALEAGAEPELPHAVAPLDAAVGLDEGQDVPDRGGGDLGGNFVVFFWGEWLVGGWEVFGGCLAGVWGVFEGVGGGGQTIRGV